MKQGWFIPVTLFGFGLSLAGLWLYVTMADTRPETLGPPPQAHPLKTARSKPTIRSTRIVDLVAGKTPAPKKQLPEPAGRPLRLYQSMIETAQTRIEQWATVAVMLDDEFVRLKSNWSGTALASALEGQALLECGLPSAALNRFDRSLRRSPGNAAALDGKAVALLALRRFDEAYICYREVLRERPDDAHAAFNCGVIAARLERYGEAASHLRHAVSADPRHARAWFNLATLAQRDGRLAEARDAWEAFTRLEPAVSAGWFNLGVMYLDYQKPVEAARCFSYVIMINPSDVDGYVNLAEAFRASGDYDAALGVLMQADRLLACDPVVLQARADTHRAIALARPMEAPHHLAEAEFIEHDLPSADTSMDSAFEVAGSLSEDN